MAKEIKILGVTMVFAFSFKVASKKSLLRTTQH